MFGGRTGLGIETPPSRTTAAVMMEGEVAQGLEIVTNMK